MFSSIVQQSLLLLYTKLESVPETMEPLWGNEGKLSSGGKSESLWWCL